MSLAVRSAEPSDLPALPEIEGTADLLFAQVGIVFPPGPTVIEQAIRDGARIYVAGDPPVGFAAVRERDGGTHLEQITVRPEHVGQGIGTLLMDRVIAHADTAGHPSITLITFRDVRWNAPWYARFGFTVLSEGSYGPELRALWAAEIAAGLHRLGPRVVMSRHGHRRPRHRTTVARPEPGSPGQRSWLIAHLYSSRMSQRMGRCPGRPARRVRPVAGPPRRPGMGTSAAEECTCRDLRSIPGTPRSRTTS